MNVIVYSANIGGYDLFSYPTKFDDNIRYILFTDNKYFKSDVWEVNHIDFLPNDLDNRLKARYLKTNPHKVLPEHDISLWVDHCFTPKFNSFENMLQQILFDGNQIMCYKHDERKCIYDESIAVERLGLDDPHKVKIQMDRYRKDNFPKNMGLFQSGFMFRLNNERVNEFNDKWWSEIKGGCGRDQLSQVYCSWKTGIPIKKIEKNGGVYGNTFLTPKTKHIPKRNNIQADLDLRRRINNLYIK